jgi:hypothetical protein
MQHLIAITQQVIHDYESLISLTHHMRSIKIKRPSTFFLLPLPGHGGGASASTTEYSPETPQLTPTRHPNTTPKEINRSTWYGEYSRGILTGERTMVTPAHDARRTRCTACSDEQSLHYQTAPAPDKTRASFTDLRRRPPIIH